MWTWVVLFASAASASSPKVLDMFSSWTDAFLIGMCFLAACFLCCVFGAVWKYFLSTSSTIVWVLRTGISASLVFWICTVTVISVYAVLLVVWFILKIKNKKVRIANCVPLDATRIFRVWFDASVILVLGTKRVNESDYASLGRFSSIGDNEIWILGCIVGVAMGLAVLMIVIRMLRGRRLRFYEILTDRTDDG